MEIGNEISQKIRSAIKAKLVDLGVYVDDELPDYIMVMVANKKSQEQMTEDLNLFLGNNTEKFTTWLHALLQKLQSITADPPKPSDPHTDIHEKTQNTTRKDTNEPEEDELLIRPEHDDFEEEAKREAAESAIQAVQTTRTPAVVVPTTAKRPDLSVSERPNERLATARSSNARGASSFTPRETSRRREHSPRRDIKSRLGSGSSRGTERSAEPTLQKQRATVRKRRVPESVVGSVVRHEEEEEQYDPRRPLIGRVASTVRVGERRPTVPPSQQANKSLLLKAMTEARDSITKATQRLTEQVALEEEDHTTTRTVTRGAERQQGVGRGRGAHSRLGGRPRIEPRGAMRSSGSSQRITRVTDQPPEPMLPENGASERSVQLYSRSKREEVLQQFRAGLHSDSEEMPDQETTDNRQIHVSSSEVADPNLVEETELRTITVAPVKDDFIKEEYEQQEYEQEYVVQDYKKPDYEEDVLDTLIESGAEESDFTEDEGEARVVEEKPPPPKERPSSPKFVVTLDGVDPASLTQATPMDMGDDMMHLGEEFPKVANVVRVAPQRVLTSTPISMDYSLDSEYADDDDSVSPAKRSRMPERCKFWLACRNGNQCPYHHPSVPCKMFPKCKFGDKCLYIHPNCRFDATCTRPNCPFTHATKRPVTAPAAALPLVIQPVNVVTGPSPFHSFSAPTTPVTPTPSTQPAVCKFFPKCTNMSCKFLHPKPCRYGVGCRDKQNCTFTHPELPPANKLKWTAPKLPSAAAR